MGQGMDEDIQHSGRRRGRPASAGDMAVDEAACLHAALSAFAEHGFEGTSVRELARTLGISHGLLGAKFGSKRALWEAAVRHGMDLLHAHMSGLPGDPGGDGDIVERMRAACRSFIVGLAEVPAIIQLMNVEGARAGDRLTFIANSFFRGRVWPIQSLLVEGQKAGVFRAVPVAVPFTLLAHGAGALIALRPLVEATGAGPRPTGANPLDHAMAAADLIVQGLIADAGG